MKKFIQGVFFHMPYGIKKFLQNLYYRIFHPSRLETRKSYGSFNPDKTIYVIRPTDHSVEGLMSLFQNVVRQLYYAEQKGYVSVVDFMNYQTQYSEASGQNEPPHNVWEYYFTQPYGISIEEAYQSHSVILSGLYFGTDQERMEAIHHTGSFDTNLLKETYQLVFDRITFSDPVMKMVEEEAKQLNLNNMLGLYVRGTDYTNLKPAGHPVQPTFEQITQEIEKYCIYSFQDIFLVTEDGKQYQLLKEKYGDRIKLASFDSFIYSYDGSTYISETDSVKELGSTAYERGLHYLVKIILLSRCRWFIGGKTKGSWAACMFNNGEYEQKTVFELGLY